MRRKRVETNNNNNNDGDNDNWRRTPSLLGVFHTKAHTHTQPLPRVSEWNEYLFGGKTCVAGSVNTLEFFRWWQYKFDVSSLLLLSIVWSFRSDPADPTYNMETMEKIGSDTLNLKWNHTHAYSKWCAWTNCRWMREEIETLIEWVVSVWGK